MKGYLILRLRENAKAIDWKPVHVYTDEVDAMIALARLSEKYQNTYKVVSVDCDALAHEQK